ncbi:MAG: cytidine deaminase [Lachnospiraceae bacterium]
MDAKQLVQEALQARKMAYTPYSDFKVGAALLTKAGRIYHGCNIENAAYSPTNCAERTAFFKAVSEGEREFEAIAIVGFKDGAASQDGSESHKEPGSEDYAYPCGVCRQVMREFTDPKEFQVIVAADEEHYKICTLAQLLPESFGPANLH